MVDDDAGSEFSFEIVEPQDKLYKDAGTQTADSAEHSELCPAKAVAKANIESPAAISPPPVTALSRALIPCNAPSSGLEERVNALNNQLQDVLSIFKALQVNRNTIPYDKIDALETTLDERKALQDRIDQVQLTATQVDQRKAAELKLLQAKLEDVSKSAEATSVVHKTLADGLEDAVQKQHLDHEATGDLINNTRQLMGTLIKAERAAMEKKVFADQQILLAQFTERSDSLSARLDEISEEHQRGLSRIEKQSKADVATLRVEQSLLDLRQKATAQAAKNEVDKLIRDSASKLAEQHKADKTELFDKLSNGLEEQKRNLLGLDQRLHGMLGRSREADRQALDAKFEQIMKDHEVSHQPSHATDMADMQTTLEQLMLQSCEADRHAFDTKLEQLEARQRAELETVKQQQKAVVEAIKESVLKYVKKNQQADQNAALERIIKHNDRLKQEARDAAKSVLSGNEKAIERLTREVNAMKHPTLAERPPVYRPPSVVSRPTGRITPPTVSKLPGPSSFGRCRHGKPLNQVCNQCTGRCTHGRTPSMTCLQCRPPGARIP